MGMGHQPVDRRRVVQRDERTQGWHLTKATGGSQRGRARCKRIRSTINLANAQRVWDVRPAVTSANGVSAQAQRAQKVPKVLNNPGGSGVSAQGTRAQKDRRGRRRRWNTQDTSTRVDGHLAYRHKQPKHSATNAHWLTIKATAMRLAPNHRVRRPTNARTVTNGPAGKAYRRNG